MPLDVVAAEVVAKEHSSADMDKPGGPVFAASRAKKPANLRQLLAPSLRGIDAKLRELQAAGIREDETTGRNEARRLMDKPGGPVLGANEVVQRGIGAGGWGPALFYADPAPSEEEGPLDVMLLQPKNVALSQQQMVVLSQQQPKNAVAHYEQMKPTSFHVQQDLMAAKDKVPFGVLAEKMGAKEHRGNG